MPLLAYLKKDSRPTSGHNDNASHFSKSKKVCIRPEPEAAASLAGVNDISSTDSSDNLSDTILAPPNDSSSSSVKH